MLLASLAIKGQEKPAVPRQDSRTASLEGDIWHMPADQELWPSEGGRQPTAMTARKKQENKYSHLLLLTPTTDPTELGPRVSEKSHDQTL